MPLRVLVCGDRNWSDETMIQLALSTLPSDTVVIEGEARGADRLARKVAERLGMTILPFPADWERYGRAAGPIRNQQMLDEGRPNIVFAFHDDLDHSRGTADMVRRAKKANVSVRIFAHPG